MSFLLEVENLSFNVGERKILDDISFSVRDGEIVGIIGPNGAGKTTFLKSINGIVEEIDGKILFNGKNIREYDKKNLARHISFMNQNTNVGFDFSCLDIVILGRYPYLKRFQEYSDEDREKAKKYMQKTNTLKFQDRMITELSGGERQRVLFAKTLTQESELILLDEPTASLDMKYEEEIFSIISQIREEGKSVIAIIHNLRVAMKYCTRLILLSGGKIIGDGTPKEIVTEKNLREIYGVDAKVYRNIFNNELDFCLI